jgi:hypothetical protein
VGLAALAPAGGGVGELHCGSADDGSDEDRVEDSVCCTTMHENTRSKSQQHVDKKLTEKIQKKSMQQTMQTQREAHCGDTQGWSLWHTR